ncbi:MAG: leucine-rich repeat domain-containing protein, partial [Clostridia bacterium]|nr:leucine-rich repeat domain-containing protein [Clostridia bacterium]
MLLGSAHSYARQYADQAGLLFCDPSAFAYTVSGGNAIITQYLDDETQVVVPPTMGGVPVSVVGEHAFASSAVEKVVLSNGIERVEEGAFASCSALREVVLPQSLHSIGDLAFEDCGSLATVSFGDELETIGKQAFYYDRALTGITLPDSLRSIGENAFEGCIGLTQINIPAGVSGLPEGAFYYCDQLATVSFAEGLVSLGARAFEGCISLANIKLPASATQIGFRAFEGCAALKTVYLPNETAVIDPSAFGEADDTAPLANPDLVLIGAPDSAAEAIAKRAGLVFDDVTLWTSESLFSYERNEDGITITGCRDSADRLILPSYIDGLPVTAIGVDAFYNCSRVHSIVLPRLLKTILN